MNANEKRIVSAAADALATLLDAVQGIACEQGAEALERYCKDPIGLMAKTSAILGGIRRIEDDGKEAAK